MDVKTTYQPNAEVYTHAVWWKEGEDTMVQTFNTPRKITDEEAIEIAKALPGPQKLRMV